MKNYLVQIIGTGVAALFSLVICSAAMAVECKGLDKGKCEQADACSWVKSYKTKSGNTVKAYCRAKAKNSSADAGTKKKSGKKKADADKKSADTKKKATKKKSKSASKKSKDKS